MYQLPIKKKGLKRNHVTALHIMLGILFVAMGAVALLLPVFDGLAKATKTSFPQYHFEPLNLLGIAYIVLGLGIIIILIAFNKKIIGTKWNILLRVIEAIALLLIFIYSIIQSWTLPIAYSGIGLIGLVLALIIENLNHKQQYIIFDDKEISVEKMNGNTIYKWQNINNIIYKYNVLTINNKDSRYIQWDIIPQNNFDQQGFEIFCKKRIDANAHLYKKDEW